MSKIPKPSDHDDSLFSNENRYSFPKLNIVKTFVFKAEKIEMQIKISYSVPAYNAAFYISSITLVSNKHITHSFLVRNNNVSS